MIPSKYCGVTGVKLVDGKIRWEVARYINGKTTYGGAFRVEHDAAKASDDLVLEHLKVAANSKAE